MGGFVTIKRPYAKKFAIFRLLQMMSEGPHCKNFL